MYKTWEYLVVDIYDSWGKADIKKISEKLNELGAQGWHLITAYTNELGKNGVAIGGVGINSTSDQNIYIFEREILNETNEEIEERKKIERAKTEEREKKEKEEMQLQEKKKIEELKESITCYDDLMSNPKIKEEAEFFRKMYGEQAYENYLDNVAKKLGLK